MPPIIESDELDDPEFKWVKQRGLGGKNKDVKFYESFTYDEVDYSLYDCVYMHKQGEPPYIGKLVKLWETADGIKRIKVQWFFRPSEISYYLKDAKVLENELFFASGDGIGLADKNPLEAIAGKCNVVCTSTDIRNAKPSAEELRMCDYVFYRIFDVNSCTISDQIGEKVGGLEVKFVFNKREGVETLDGPKLDYDEKYQVPNVLACNGTLEIAGNSSPQQLLDNNVNHALGEKYTNVVSSRNKEITLTTLEERRSTASTKNLDSNITEKKDEEINLTVSHIEKGVKTARKSFHLDEAPSKRAKLDGSVSSDSNGAQGPSVSRNDAANRKDVFLAGKDKRIGGNLSFSREKQPESNALSCVETQRPSTTNASPNETPKSLTNKEFNALGRHKSREKEGCVETQRPSTTNASPNETPISLSNKELNAAGRDKSREEGSRQGAKRHSTLSCLTKGPLGIHDEGFKEKPHLGHDKSLTKEKKLANSSSFKDEGHTKKAKIDNSIKGLEDTKNNKINNLKENNSFGEPKISPRCATSGDKNVKSRLGEGPSKEYHNEKAKAEVGKTKILPISVTRDNKANPRIGEGPYKEHHNEKDGKQMTANLPNPLTTKSKDVGVKVRGKVFEVTPRPPEKPSWIKIPWDQQMKAADDQKRLVLLQNLDPEYTSGEVEDIMYHAFKESCTARMVPHTAISNPYSGQAFVVFKSSAAADKVVQTLNDRCLMLPNQRPLVACYGVFPKCSGKQTFVGHLAIDKARRQMQRDMGAVSTSHYSQHNTIEFEMAMDWCLLQSKSDKWWETLHQEQRKELKRFTENLKSNA